MPLKLYRRPIPGRPESEWPWHISGTVRGVRCRETTGTRGRKQAEAYRAKREAELFEEAIYGKRAVVSFQRAALSYLEDGDEARGAQTKFFVGRLVDHFGAKRLAEIGQQEADAAVIAIVGAKAAPGTKNRGVLTPLIAILNHSAARGWCESPKIGRKAEPKVKTLWITPRQAIALCDAASPHLRPLLHFILCTGARLSEALDLDWRDVDLANAKAVFRDTKSGKDRFAALPTAAVTLLANMPADEKGEKKGRVFRRDDGQPYKDRKRLEGGQIKTAFLGACRRAGMASKVLGPDGEPLKRETRVTGLKGPGKVRTREVWKADVTPHTLRHTWASWFYALTRDPMLLRDEGGWASIGMVERYAHLMNDAAMIGEICNVWGVAHPRIGNLPIGTRLTQEDAPNSATA